MTSIKNKNIPKIVKCLRLQCAKTTPKPCWIRSTPPLLKGVNLHGFLLSEIGLGESARLLHAALTSQGVAVAACNRVLAGRQNDDRFLALLSSDAPYSVSLCVDGLLGFRGLRHEICRQKVNVAYPFWELETIPQKYVTYLSHFDRIWAPSTFIYQTLVAHGVERVDLIKHPLLMPEALPAPRASGGPLKFLVFFDFDSFPARKNPEAAVTAFRAAFPTQTDVTLTVKVRGQRDVGRRDWLAAQAAADPRIAIRDQTYSRAQMETLMADHDVFLSLHRSEGLGLGCAEAIAAGKIVVATDYGGSTDFVTEQTGFPVAWTALAVEKDDYILVEDTKWADPAVDDAANKLRQIYDDLDAAHAKAVTAFTHLAQNHAIHHIGALMKGKLKI